MSRHLLIRADANAKIGTGHVMRCLALAQAWQDNGGTVSLAALELPEGLQQRLQSEQVEVIPFPAGTEADDAANLVSLAKGRAECVVVDGYAFGIAHQRVLREAGIRQLFIDDYGHASEYVADFVLNQNITADELLYRDRAPNTNLLLGTKYALLRREFRKLKGWTRELAPKATKVMVTMGGADDANITLRVLRALEGLNRQTQVRALVGPANRNGDSLEEFRRKSAMRVEILNSQSVPELMQWADVAVTAAGSTCWELLFMQLSVIAICVAENQAAIAARLGRDRIADVFSSPDTMEDALAKLIGGLLEDRSERLRRSQIGRELVNGEGAVLVSKFLRDGSNDANRFLRE